MAEETKNDKIQDAVIRRQIQVVRLGTSQGTRANETISETDKELAAAIALALMAITDAPTKQNLERLAALQRKITRIRKPAFNKAESDQDKDMQELAQAESDWTVETIGAIAGLLLLPLTGLQIERIISLIPFAGRTSSQWWETALQADILRIMTNVQAGIQDGLTIREIVESITGSKRVPGILKTTENQVNAAAATITTGVSAESQLAIIKKNDGFDRVLWVSVLDHVTTVVCRGLSGLIWNIRESHPTPPAHAKCRSSLTYLLKGTPLPDEPSYDTWIRKQPESFQRDTLPKWQFEEMKKGTPLRAFVTKDIKPISMKEFRRMR